MYIKNKMELNTNLTTSALVTPLKDKIFCFALVITFCFEITSISIKGLKGRVFAEIRRASARTRTSVTISSHAKINRTT